MFSRRIKDLFCFLFVFFLPVVFDVLQYILELVFKLFEVFFVEDIHDAFLELFGNGT